MSSSDDSRCRGALQPGLLVKDRMGTRKRITRVEDHRLLGVRWPAAGGRAE
jgi:hypothetical protein